MRVWLLFPLLLLHFAGFAQNSKEGELIQKAGGAKGDAEKVRALNDLAEYYYVFKLDQKADSVLQVELQVAEQSQDKELVFQVLFSNAILNIGSWTSAATFERTAAFLEKGLNHAKESGRADYLAMAYIRKAGFYRKQHDFEKAIENATHAFSALGNTTEFDSLKSSMYLEMGRAFLGKGDAGPAFRNFNNAFDLAYSIKNVHLESEAYHHFSELYLSVGNTDLAKDYLYKSLQLNREKGTPTALLKDFYSLARITEDKTYIHKTDSLATALNNHAYMLYAKRMMFAYLMVK